MTTDEKISALRKEIDTALTPLINSDYVLYSLPYYTNIGDTLIWEGTRDFLKSVKHKCVGVCGWNDYPTRPPRPGTTILILGGGFFGDVWRTGWQNVLDGLRGCEDYPIIILPQSIFYEDREVERQDAEYLSKFKNLTICVRDDDSLRRARQSFNNPSILVPDMAFHIDTRRLREQMSSPEAATLYHKRADKERINVLPVFGANEAVHTGDWPVMEQTPLWLADFSERESGLRAGQDNAGAIDRMYEQEFRPQLIRCGVEFYSAHNRVVTTRLHGMVLAFLLGIPVEFIDNSYGKVSALYRTWLSDLPESTVSPIKHFRKVRISVIVPVWGVEDYIVDCLKSIGAQQVDCEVECIVVNDCTPDRSMTLAREFAESYTGPVEFRFIEREANGGLSAARNSGLDVAEGDYVCFVDSDDELPAGALNTMLGAIQQFNADILITEYATTATTRRMPHNKIAMPALLERPALLEAACDWRLLSMACAKLYDASFLRQHNLRFTEGLLHEDELWSMECAIKAGKIGIISDECYLYKLRDDSITMAENAGHLRRRRDSMTRIICRIWQDFNDSGIAFSKALDFGMRERILDFFTTYVNTSSEQELFEIYRAIRRATPAHWRRAAIIDGLTHAHRRYHLHLLLPERLGFRRFLKILNKHTAANNG